MSIIINSESNKVTVRPDKNAQAMSNSDMADYKFEFNFSNTQLQELNAEFGIEVFNNTNPITGDTSDMIIEHIIMPLIKLSEMESLFLEVLRHIRS
jgi:hypothetical protein